MGKYIKGKDGKFKGSLPSPSSVPQLPSEKALPKAPTAIFDEKYLSNFYANLEKEKYDKAIANPEYLKTVSNLDTYNDAFLSYEEENFCASIESKHFKSFGGGAMEDDDIEGLYNASVGGSHIFGGEEYLASKQFRKLEEAKAWMTEETNKRTFMIIKFKELIKADPYGLEKTINNKLLEIGRADLTPISPDMYNTKEGLEVNGTVVRVGYAYVHFTAYSVLAKKPEDSRLAGNHGFYQTTSKNAVLFGLFIALND